MDESKIINAYKDGSDIKYIAECFEVKYEDVLNVIYKYKEENKQSNKYTDEFKQMIAERDTNGVSRTDIAKELKLSVSTVRNACNEFGEGFKNSGNANELYRVLEGSFEMNSCPLCKSKRNNTLEGSTNRTYCFDCSNEFTYKEDHVLILNWEYL